MIESRRLGFGEAVRAFNHDLLAGTGLLVKVVKAHRPIRPEVVSAAVRILHGRHPLLRCVIRKREDGYLYFESTSRFDDIPVTRTQRADGQTTIDVAEAETALPLQADRHLWRVTYVCSPAEEDDEIILAIHHSISDGTSVYAFFRELFELCAAIENGETPAPATLPLLPPVEELLDLSAFPDLVERDTPTSSHRSERFESLLAVQPTWSYAACPPLERRRTKVLCRVVDEGSTRRMVESCKTRSCTLGAAMTSAMVLALGEVRDQSVATVVQQPLNLRPYCRPPVGADHIGFYVSMVCLTPSFSRAPGAFWDIAFECRRQLRERMPGFASARRDYRPDEVYPRLGRTAFTYALGISNHGVQARAALSRSQSAVTADDFVTTLANRVAGDIGILNVASTVNQRQQFSFIYSEPLLPTKVAAQFADEFVAQLARNLT